MTEGDWFLSSELLSRAFIKFSLEIMFSLYNNEGLIRSQEQLLGFARKSLWMFDSSCCSWNERVLRLSEMKDRNSLKNDLINRQEGKKINLTVESYLTSKWIGHQMALNQFNFVMRCSCFEFVERAKFFHVHHVCESSDISRSGARFVRLKFIVLFALKFCF